MMRDDEGLLGIVRDCEGFRGMVRMVSNGYWLGMIRDGK